MFDPVAQISPGQAGLIRQQGRLVGRTLPDAEVGLEWVLIGFHASRFVGDAGMREAEPPPRRCRRRTAMMANVGSPGRWSAAILSNSADGARREEQRRFVFEELVDVIVYSHEVGWAKPDPAIFNLTGGTVRR